MNLPTNAKEITTEVKFLIGTSMLTWITIKKISKKTWTWLKHNWVAPLVVIYTLILWLLFRKSGKAEALLDIRSESYKSQIEAINKAHEDEIKKRDEIFNEYNKTLDKITKKYEEDKKELTNKKKKEIKDIVEKYHDDPDGLAKEIADKFGFNYEG